MTKAKVILNLSAVIFSMLLLQQNAFSDTTKVTELIKTDVKIGTGPEATGGQEG